MTIYECMNLKKRLKNIYILYRKHVFTIKKSPISNIFPKKNKNKKIPHFLSQF